MKHFLFCLLFTLTGCIHSTKQLFSYATQLDGKDIFRGKSQGYTVFYDDTKSDAFVEYGMGKFANIDLLTKDSAARSKGILASNEHSKLYLKGDKLYYRNTKIGLKARLIKTKISENDHESRENILKTKYFHLTSNWLDNAESTKKYHFYCDSVMVEQDFIEMITD